MKYRHITIVVIVAFMFGTITSHVTTKHLVAQEYERQFSEHVDAVDGIVSGLATKCEEWRLRSEAYRNMLVEMGVDMQAADWAAETNVLR